MATTDQGSFTIDDGRFERLCNKGMRKGKAARIANAANYPAAHRGGSFSKYDKWTTDQLYKKAVDEGIDGCAHMNKRALINALREH